MFLKLMMIAQTNVFTNLFLLKKVVRIFMIKYGSRSKCEDMQIDGQGGCVIANVHT